MPAMDFSKNRLYILFENLTVKSISPIWLKYVQSGGIPVIPEVDVNLLNFKWNTL